MPRSKNQVGHGWDSESGLSPQELLFLWQVVKDLQKCDSVQKAEARIAETTRSSLRSPLVRQAFLETTQPILKNLKEREELQNLVMRDPLTGLHNRRYMEDELLHQIDTIQREETPLAIALIDLDRFRAYNRRHGHIAGDRILQTLTFLLQQYLSDNCTPCRYGGEEFVLIMPGMTGMQAKTQLELFREHLAACTTHPDGQPIQPITASIGVAEFPACGITETALLNAADRAMYNAKKAGRNQICVSTPNQ
ncbi:MAG: GGDEF domain-containing protein [Pirellulales bacterium]